MLFGETPGLRPRSEESIMFESSEDENLSTPAGFGRYFQNRIIKILRPEKFFQCRRFCWREINREAFLTASQACPLSYLTPPKE